MGRTTALLAAGALAVTAGLAAAAPAMASSHIPPPVGAYKLCLLSDHSRCVQSNGVGNQATLATSGYATFSPHQVINSSTGIWYNQSGACAREKNDGTVEFSNSCSGDTASYWVIGSQSTLINYSHGGLMSTHSDTTGAGVDVGDSWRMVFLGT